MPQPWGYTLHFKVFLNFHCHLIDICRVTPKDDGITRIRGLCEVVAKHGTYILVMPPSKDVTRRKETDNFFFTKVIVEIFQDKTIDVQIQN